jgi:hypothetical protein
MMADYSTKPTMSLGFWPPETTIWVFASLEAGRIALRGGLRNIWGLHTVVPAQQDVAHDDGEVAVAVATDGCWGVIKGPITFAGIYDERDTT